jgi:hypothetical protein
VLLHPWLPERMGVLLGALGAPDLALEGARLGAGSLSRVEKMTPLFPKQPSEAAA